MGIITNNVVIFLIADFNKIPTTFGDYIEESI